MYPVSPWHSRLTDMTRPQQLENHHEYARQALAYRHQALTERLALATGQPVGTTFTTTPAVGTANTTGTTPGASVGHGIKGVWNGMSSTVFACRHSALTSRRFLVIHGAGETIRGAINGTVDQAGSSPFIPRLAMPFADPSPLL